MDGGAWWAAVHGVAKSWTRLSEFTFTFRFHALEKEMAAHSSDLAWRIPGTGAWWAAVYGVTQSWTRLKQLSSSSSSMSIESVMPSNHLVVCRPLLLPSIFSSIRVFSNEAALCTRWSNYWSFNFSISLSNEYSGLISFRIDWFDLLAVRGTLKNLFQHHSSKAQILLCSAYLSHVLTSVHDYWKNHSFDYTDLCQQSNVSAM